MARTYGKAQDLIDFTRASGGTALRRVKYGAELVDTANDASAWSAYGSNTVVQDGDAVKATYVDSASGAYIYLIPSQGTSQQLAIGTLYTLTANAKVNTGSVSVEVYDGSLPNQVAVSSTSYIDVQINFVANGLNPYIRLANMGSGEIIWIKNISVKEVTFDTSDGDLILFNHPANIPRIEYDADGNLLGLLVEESRTNLVLYSEDFTQSEWVKLGAGTGSTAVVTSGFPSPAGQNNATRLQCNLNGGTSNSDQSLIYDSMSGTGDHSITFWVKSNTESNQTFLFGNSLTTSDLGVATGEWQRFVYSGTLPANRNVFIGARGGTGSDDTLDILIYGAQLEAGSFPTSYIPTSGSTATRSADVASIGVDGFGYRQDEGTVVVDLRYNGVGTSPRILCFSDGTNTNRIVLDRIPMVTVVNNNSVTVSDTTTSSSSVLTPYKVGLSLSDSNTSITIDGETPSTSSGTIPKVISKLIIGDGQTSPRYINGHIKSLRYYPRALTNAQLQELTS